MAFFSNTPIAEILAKFDRGPCARTHHALVVRTPKVDGKGEVQLRFPLDFTIKEVADATYLEAAGPSPLTYSGVNRDAPLWEAAEEAVSQLILRALMLRDGGERAEVYGREVRVYWVK